MLKATVFREYDIRGIADEDLVDENIVSLGKGIGTFLSRQGAKSLVIGRDIRLSSERLRNALIEGLLSTGVNVIDVGVCLTPVQYFGIIHLDADGGVMITGSHNPIEYNGFKISKRGVAPVYGEEIQEIRKLIEGVDFETGSGELVKKDVISDYVDMIKSKLNFGRKLKLVIDAGNGTAGILAPQLWRDLGCDVVELYCEPDGTFPNHLPDPTVPKYVVDLQKKVLEVGADVGIGYDGDTDRVGVIDEKGRMIFADKLIAILIREVLQKHPGGKIVFDVKCSQALPEEIIKFGGEPVMYKTGHSLLKAKMKELQSPLAGEMSGHIFYSDDFFGFDDAVYVSGRLLRIMSNTDKTLAELVDEIPSFESTPEIRIEATDEDKFKIVAELSEHFKRSYETIDIDGARVLFGDGWGLVRASNTQPVLVLRFEARSKERLAEIIEIFKSKLREYPSVKFSDSDFEIA
ncbi:phosphomannomutase/phosphoglucomutase [candidate division KSB1 bacterium]|nr:phosphomannomutase/phosphoglucomutase [candidate division KSB1 bacterium]